MANGTITGSGSKVYLKINWSSTPGVGGSTVTATLICQNASNIYLIAQCKGGYGITINGSEKRGTDYVTLSKKVGGNAILISHSVWVPYTGDGPTITIKGDAGTDGIRVDGVNIGDLSVSGTATLDKIGSRPSMSGSLNLSVSGIVSETTNSVTLSWTKPTSYNGKCEYYAGYSINDWGYNYQFVSSDINTTSFKMTIYPVPGDRYHFAIYCVNDVGQSDTLYSNQITINSLSPPTIGDIQDYNPYVNSTLTVPLSGGGAANGENFVRMCNLYYDDTYLCGCKAYSDTAWKNTTQTITYAAANYAAKIGTKSYSSSQFKIEAWIENANHSKSTNVYHYFTVNLNSDGKAGPVIPSPTLDGGAFSNPSTCFIAGVSTINVTVPNATPNRAASGTTITSYKVSCNGASTQNGQNASFTGLTSGVKNIAITVTDSRGASATITKQVMVQAYSAPTINNFSIQRLTDPVTSAKLVYTLKYSPIYQYTDINTKGNQLNGISVQQYKKETLDWATASNGLVLTNLEAESAYTVQLRVSDKVKPSTYRTMVRQVPTMKTSLGIRDWGIGVNCVPQSSYALEVIGNSHLSEDLTLDGTCRIGKDLIVDGKINGSSYGNLSTTGQLIKDGISTSWVNGRNTAAVRMKSVNGYSPAVSIKTANGSWEIGTYNNTSYGDKMTFTFITDENYNNNTNKTTKQYVLGVGTTLANNALLTVNDIYPVGSIILNIEGTNPGTRFPGTTWVQISTGKYLVGQGYYDDGNYNRTMEAGASGGVWTHYHKYGIAFNEWYNSWSNPILYDGSGMSYRQTLSKIGQSNVPYNSAVASSAVTKSAQQLAATSYTTESYTLPPYTVVYVWQRTA